MWRMLLVLGRGHSLAAYSLIAPASAVSRLALISNFLLLNLLVTLSFIYALPYSATIYATGV
jgi:hypothetical protein